MRHMERDIALCTKETPTRPAMIIQRNKTRFSCEKRCVVNMNLDGWAGNMVFVLKCPTNVQINTETNDVHRFALHRRYSTPQMTCLGSWRLSSELAKSRIPGLLLERKSFF